MNMNSLGCRRLEVRPAHVGEWSMMIVLDVRISCDIVSERMVGGISGKMVREVPFVPRCVSLFTLQISAIRTY